MFEAENVSVFFDLQSAARHAIPDYLGRLWSGLIEGNANEAGGQDSHFVTGGRFGHLRGHRLQILGARGARRYGSPLNEGAAHTIRRQDRGHSSTPWTLARCLGRRGWQGRDDGLEAASTPSVNNGRITHLPKTDVRMVTEAEFDVFFAVKRESVLTSPRARFVSGDEGGGHRRDPQHFRLDRGSDPRPRLNLVQRLQGWGHRDKTMAVELAPFRRTGHALCPRRGRDPLLARLLGGTRPRCGTIPSTSRLAFSNPRNGRGPGLPVLARIGGSSMITGGWRFEVERGALHMTAYNRLDGCRATSWCMRSFATADAFPASC